MVRKNRDRAPAHLPPPSPSPTPQVAAELTGDVFEAFFDRLYPRAVRVARRITGDSAVAEELASEAFARAFARWSRLDDSPRRDGWVIRVTVNLAIDSGRRRQPELSVAPSQDHADQVAVRLALTEALRHLPRRQRDVVCLRYLADLPEAEVAATLGISTGSVKTHLHRALERLRFDLGGTDELAMA